MYVGITRALGQFVESNASVDILNASGEYLGAFTGIVFRNPRAIAVNQATGAVYVVDEGEVDVFSSTGVFESQFAAASSTPGGFGEVDGIVLDEVTDQLLISTRNPSGVFVFTTAGAYVTTWTGANTPQGSFGGGRVGIATSDATGEVGDVFVTGGGVVDQFDPAGAYVGQISSAPGGPLAAESVAVDTATGDEYVGSCRNNQEEGGCLVDIFGPLEGGPVLVTGAQANVQASSATLNGVVSPEGLDANSIQFEYGTTTAYGSLAPASPSTCSAASPSCAATANLTELAPDTLYHYRLAGTDSEGTTHGFDRVFRTFPEAPAVNASASDVTQFTADLSGTINPGNAPTAYHFVYGPTSAYGSVAPTPDLFTPANDTDDPVSQTLTGLQANTTYHFALVAINGAATVTGPDETFTTTTIPPPAVSTGAASAATQGQVTLAGAINPQGWDTTYHFDYGTSTAYGSSWPTVDIDEGALMGSQPVSILLQNLSPGTTYHYRLVATNGGGTAYGADGTFTTAEYPLSIIQTAPVLGTFKLPSIAPPSKPLTKAQKLSKALEACRKQDKKNKGKRQSCEKAAKQKYGPVKKKAKK